ncbi:MAG TPA: hypothetical protein VE176_12580, partial [Candidatus Limnocylindrales bacterium]|nr:hypothetical protein [Candidatus Limnocylindrales bacterium]
MRDFLNRFEQLSGESLHDARLFLGTPAHYSAFKNNAPSGGNLKLIDQGLLCAGCASAFTPPRFPTPLPPYSLASLFNNSRQYPSEGTPTRYASRTTGVKLQTTR